MKQWACLVLFFFAACNGHKHTDTRTTESGIQYTIHHKKPAGKRAMIMSTAKINVTYFRNDTAVPSRMPAYQLVLPPAPYTSDPIAEVLIWGEVGEGDSVVAITKDNKRVAFSVKKIYIPGENGLNSDSLIQIDKNNELKKLVASETKIAATRIKNYLDKNSIAAEQNGDNIYVQYISKGTGIKADSGKTAGIKFRISDLYTGKVLNSNIDTSFHQPPVLEFIVGRGFMLKPVDHVLSQMGKGGRAKVFIPGVMTVGGKAADPATDLTRDVVCELELVSVK